MGRKLLVLGIASQVALALFIALVPFGFDKPSKWGLDFEDFMVCGAFYCLLLLGGLTLAIAQKRWWLLLLQLAIAAIGMAAVAIIDIMR